MVARCLLPAGGQLVSVSVCSHTSRRPRGRLLFLFRLDELGVGRVLALSVRIKHRLVEGPIGSDDCSQR
jgi:hypothetical protein